MSIAVIQMVSQDDVTANLAAARRLLEQAAEGGARLAVLPENFAAMGRRDLTELGRAEARGNGPILPWLNSAARDLRLWIVAGTLPLPPEGQPEAKANACSLLIDEHGERVARYDKLHLFDVDVADARGRYRESDDYAFGQKIVVADTPVGRLGLTVCYDLRFPELYTALREAGAELITAPSAFTAVTGAAHWQVLVRARAIETQCYLLAAGRVASTHGAGRRSAIRPSSIPGAGSWPSGRRAKRCCWRRATPQNRRISAGACRWWRTDDFSRRPNRGRRVRSEYERVVVIRQPAIAGPRWSRTGQPARHSS